MSDILDVDGASKGGRRRDLHRRRIRIHSHQQDWWNYCGAAVGQALLEFDGVHGVRQEEILSRARNELRNGDPDARAGDWECSPAGLATVLNRLAPAREGQSPYRRSIYANPWTLAMFVAHRIECGLPVAVHVKGVHWVLAVGFASDRAPKSADDPTVKIRCLEWLDPVDALHNPGFVPDGRPPPHHHGDNCDQILTACRVDRLPSFFDQVPFDTDRSVYCAVARDGVESLIPRDNGMTQAVALTLAKDELRLPVGRGCLELVPGAVLGAESVVVRYGGGGANTDYLLTPVRVDGKITRFLLLDQETRDVVAEQVAGQTAERVFAEASSPGTLLEGADFIDGFQPSEPGDTPRRGRAAWMGTSPATSPFRPAVERVSGLSGDVFGWISAWGAPTR